MFFNESPPSPVPPPLPPPPPMAALQSRPLWVASHVHLPVPLRPVPEEVVSHEFQRVSYGVRCQVLDLSGTMKIIICMPVVHVSRHTVYTAYTASFTAVT